MKKAIENLRKGKYVSLTLTLVIAFTFASSYRYYINESVYAAFNLGNLGEFGTKLSVSVLVVVFAALGWTAGFLTAFLTRKKSVDSVTLYWLSGMFAVVALFFTPYNLQLLMPSTIMQNIAMIACIAHIVFMLVDMWLFGWAIFRGCADVLSQNAKKGIIFICSATVVATMIGFISIGVKWSFVVQTSVCGSLLIAFNVLQAAFPACSDSESSKESEIGCCYGRSRDIVSAAVTVMFAAVLIGAYFIAESYMTIV